MHVFTRIKISCLYFTPGYACALMYFIYILQPYSYSHVVQLSNMTIFIYTMNLAISVWFIYLAIRPAGSNKHAGYKTC